jgi:hypothetical protein
MECVLREAVVELPNAASDQSCEADSGGLVVETGLKTEKLSSTLLHQVTLSLGLSFAVWWR